MVRRTAAPRHLLLALIAALAAACDDGGAPDGDAGVDGGDDTDSESDTGGDAPCVIHVDGALGAVGADGASLLDSPLWLGASDAGGDWAWAADEPWDFDAWGDGQPSGADGADCLTLDPLDASWSDAPCAAARPFVCERDD